MFGFLSMMPALSQAHWEPSRIRSRRRALRARTTAKASEPAAESPDSAPMCDELSRTAFYPSHPRFFRSQRIVGPARRAS
jgi:hypothetical protein